jgi:hypothetical protein
VGIEYPSGSGKIRYETSTFETLDPPTFKKVLSAQQRLNQLIPGLTDANPYMVNPFTAGLQHTESSMNLPKVAQ